MQNKRQNTGWKISIHALREEGDLKQLKKCIFTNIYIHALRLVGDSPFFVTIIQKIKFLSTPSVRRATKCLKAISWTQTISIHALREEGDQQISESMA